MSNKNLKVYKIQFLTDVKTLHFNVKFPCQIKMIWKRSNQSAETTLMPVKDGQVAFHTTLKLNVNMYYDTLTNKFVQKKCLYSFLIVTEKGQKSAGSVTLDLAQFFNKRVYQFEQSFVLEKCPVPNTKIDMKIYYEESTEQGYDSMSKISVSSELDLSTASFNLNQMASGSSELSSSFKEKSENQDTTSKESETEKSRKVIDQEQQRLQKLNQSDVGEYIPENTTKIGQNIKSISNITSKINEFVAKCSGNIKFQMEAFKRKNNQLEQQLNSMKNQQEKTQRLLNEQRKKNNELSRQYQNYKLESESMILNERKTTQELQAKQKTNNKLLSQLEEKMSQTGSSQSSYISQLKLNQQNNENVLRNQIKQLQNALILQKKQKSNLSLQVDELEVNLTETKSKYIKSYEKASQLENDMLKREKDLEATRIKLEETYQYLVQALGNLNN